MPPLGLQAYLPATRQTLAISCPHTALCCMLAGCPVRLSARIPSCHWWYETHSHAAELTAVRPLCHVFTFSNFYAKGTQPCRRAYSGKAIVSLFYLFLLFLQKEHSHVTELTAVRPLCHFFYRFHFFRKRNTAMSQSLKR